MRRITVPSLYETVSLTFRNSKHYKLNDTCRLIRATESITFLSGKIINYLANEVKIIKNILFNFLIEFEDRKFNLKFNGDFGVITGMIKEADLQFEKILAGLKQSDSVLIESKQDGKIMITYNKG